MRARFDYVFRPEQARDPRNADIRSDIYSLGCTFFFMLAGRPPFPEGTVLQKLLQHQGDQPPEYPGVSPGTARGVEPGAAEDDGQRPAGTDNAGPADLVADLLLLAEQIGLRPMSPSSRIWLVPQGPPVRFFQWALPMDCPCGGVGVHCLAAGLVLGRPRRGGTINYRQRRRR